MNITISDAQGKPCAACGHSIPGTLLVCPACQALVHRDRLQSLSVQATGATQAGHLSHAQALWRQAMELLPPESRQALTIASRMEKLREGIDLGTDRPGPPPGETVVPASSEVPAAPPTTGARGTAGLGVLGVLAALAFKFKFALLWILTKFKLIVYGLGKGSTLFTMVGTIGVYWSLWGWPLAVGLVISIYIHEMGHVAALGRYGIAASAPMFIPGLGALIRLQQVHLDPVEDARIGLAGPIWGLGAAFIAWAAAVASNQPMLAAIAHLGAVINLFNLIPLGQLDGGRGFRGLAKSQRILVILVLVALWHTTREGMLMLIGLAAVARLFDTEKPAGNRRVLLEFLGLLVALSVLAIVNVDVSPRR